MKFALLTAAAPNFSNGQIVGTVSSGKIREASGLAASRKHHGYFYTHNDHGDGPRIYILDGTGHLESTISLHGVTSHDYEDIAVGPCAKDGNETCVYIGKAIFW